MRYSRWLQAESEKSENLFLYIDMPRFDFPIVFSEPVSPRACIILWPCADKREQEYPTAMPATLLPLPNLAAPNSTVSAATAGTLFPRSSLSTNDPGLFHIVDPEVARDNPVEAKHRRLVRSHRNGPLDRELKPNAKIRDELNVRPFSLLLNAADMMRRTF